MQFLQFVCNEYVSAEAPFGSTETEASWEDNICEHIQGQSDFTTHLDNTSNIPRAPHSEGLFQLPLVKWSGSVQWVQTSVVYFVGIIVKHMLSSCGSACLKHYHHLDS